MYSVRPRWTAAGSFRQPRANRLGVRTCFLRFRRGEVVGIVGRNGGREEQLLKIWRHAHSTPAGGYPGGVSHPGIGHRVYPEYTGAKTSTWAAVHGHEGEEIDADRLIIAFSELGQH